jgi:hypothetical protein
MVTLASKKVWHLGRLIMARSRLVVAMRLHKQLSSFWLRILSNTPSCSEESHERNTFANLKDTHFLFCNTGLRNAWMNRHNSRQDCKLEELTNQTNRPSNKVYPRSAASIVWTQKSRESSSIWRLVLLPSKEWWKLRRWHPKGPRTITVRFQDSIWVWPNQRVNATNKVLLDS